MIANYLAVTMTEDFPMETIILQVYKLCEQMQNLSNLSFLYVTL